MRVRAHGRAARWVGAVFLVATAFAAGGDAEAFSGGHHHGHHHDDDDDDDDDDEEEDGCDSVKGKFGAMSVPVPPCTSPVGVCTHGILKGSLDGTYDLTVDTLAPAPHPDVPTVNFFTGESLLILDNGDMMTGVDTGALNLAPPMVIGSGSFSTLLTFVDGGAGWLHIRGVLDLTTGQVTGKYNGVICTDDV